MKSTDFASKCKAVAKDYITTYVWGGIGAPINEASIADKVNQYPKNRANGYEKNALALIGKKAFMFDCVGLIKSILWGWNGDSTKYNGGAVYNSNGVPDVTADTMITKCADVSTDFSKIDVGEVVWMLGHIGVYIGDGFVVEATPAFKNGVQITACANIGTKSGYSSRRWTKHGKLPYVIYDIATSDESRKNITVVVDGKEVKCEGVLQGGKNYVWIRDIAPALGYEVGNRGNVAVLTKKK